MKRAKHLFAAVICAGLLVGCQQAGSPATQRAAEADSIAKALESARAEQKDDYTPSAPFKAKHDELALKLSERLLTKCFRARKEMEACFRERFLVGFDTDGMAKSHCPKQPDIEADITCIMLGGIGYQLAQKVGKDAVAAFDWNEPEESADEVLMELVLQQVRHCLTNGSASDPQSCLVQRVTKALDLTQDDIDPCNSLSDDDEEFGHCIGDAFAYKYVSAALTRM